MSLSIMLCVTCALTAGDTVSGLRTEIARAIETGTCAAERNVLADRVIALAEQSSSRSTF